MRRRLFAAVAAFAISMTVQAKRESVKFQAGDYADFRQLVSREVADLDDHRRRRR